MGITKKFKEFCTSLRLSEHSVGRIRRRYEQIEKIINSKYYKSTPETSHCMYVGSYGRGTDIHVSVSDIDIIVVLPQEVYNKYDNYQGNGQTALLKEVTGVIQKNFKSAYIGRNGRVIVVKFPDGITFGILPAFFNQNGTGFTYPETTSGGSWKNTNPKAEIDEMIRADNEDCNNNLRRLCRMTRAWKDERKVPISGLLIDTLAYNFIINWKHRKESYTYYDWMMRDFFEYLANLNKDQKYWYSPGAKHYVWKKGNFELEAKKCHKIAAEAVENECQKKHLQADHKWIQIFGKKFPELTIEEA